jgi:hypothetical protein
MLAAYVVPDKRLKLDIAIVEIDSLHLHEDVVQELLKYLMLSIKVDGCVKHPIIVDRKSLVVLDGVHRVVALRKLGIRRVPACLVDYSDPSIQVLNWYRTLTGTSDIESAMSQIRKTGCNVERISKVSEKMLGISPAVAAIRSKNRIFLIKCPFKSLQEDYRIIGKVENRLRAIGLRIRYETKRDALERLRDGQVDAVIYTPKVTKDEIVKSALSAHSFAWKATRHVVPARPVNVNVPLRLLTAGDMSLAQANRELKNMLLRKRLRRFPAGTVIDGRRYEEELYAFEE